ncbi:MAG: DUF333 domain-containing protein [Candidatus Pacebacteria bacterium]|nr:DUF333 domain-containing protein [Candidatus Paceibacterota bacterium]
MNKQAIYFIILITLILVGSIFYATNHLKNGSVTENIIEEIENQKICTLEYAPVCGIDEKTYSNSCMAGEVEVAYVGECKKEDKTSLANPASTNCLDKGGQIVMDTKPDGEYGICLFEDNRQCEEWALFNGACPVGGVKITGYDTASQIYCAIRGGEVDMNVGTCTIKEDTCLIQDYYDGTCR